MNAPTNRQFVFLSTCVFLVYIGVLLFGFGPIWETNDDVGMAMIAHGYGFIGNESPMLLYSNVIWGQLVSSLPIVFGFDGYSIATYLVLLVVGVSLSFSLFEHTKRVHVSILIVALVLFKPIIEPQFTINSGLMMSAAVFWLISFSSGSNAWRLTLFVVFAFISYMLRSQEAMFVLLVAIPLIYAPSRLKQTAVWISFVILGGVAFIAHSIDKLAYSSEDWHTYTELNTARAPYTDFGADKHVATQPEVLEKYGYSTNDVSLIANWFFLDEKIAFAPALNGMLKDAKFFDLKRPRSINPSYIFERISSYYLGGLLFLVLGLLLYSRSYRLLLSFAVFFTVVGFLFYIGRGHVLRIYYPVVSLMFLYGCAQLNWSFSWFDRKSIARFLTLAALIAYSVNWLFIVIDKKEGSAQLREIVLGLKHEYPIVAWGRALDYSAIYRIGELDSALLQKKLIALGSSSLMPNSNASIYAAAGDGVINTLRSNGTIFIAGQSEINFLDRYCIEKYESTLESRVLGAVGNYQAFFVKCSAIQP